MQNRSNTRSSRVSHSRSGAVALEFAITSSLVFFFFFTALEFCRVAMIRHTVENALYEGARTGIIPGATSAEVRQATSSVLSKIGVASNSIDVLPSTIRNDTPEITVRIRMPLDRGLFAPAFFFLGKSLDRSLTLQREGIR